MGSKHDKAPTTIKARKTIEGTCPNCLNQIHLLVDPNNPTPEMLEVPRHQKNAVIVCDTNGRMTVTKWRGGQPIFNQ